jgi:DNA mismatch repair protein MutL
VELSAHQILAVNSLQKGLALLGFELEPFGGATYVIKGFPAVLDPTEAKEALLETLAKAQSRLKELDGSDLKDLLDKMSDSWLDTLACRAAVKAGDKLTLAEMETLTKDIEAAIAGGFCPHGRPAITVITYKELESKFNRR